MTAITPSECAMMRDKLEQTQVKLGGIRFGTHGADASYLALQATLASHDLIYRLEQLQRRLDQQEQASAKTGLELAVENQDELLTEAQNRAHEEIRNATGFISDTSSQFAVGDTVRYDGKSPFYVATKYANYDLTISETNKKYYGYDGPCAQCCNPELGETGQCIPLANLTLVRKAGD